MAFSGVDTINTHSRVRSNCRPAFSLISLMFLGCRPAFFLISLIFSRFSFLLSTDCLTS